MGTLEKFRSSRLQRLDLPSGLTIEVKPIDIEQVMLSGAIPLDLVSQLEQKGERTKDGKLAINVSDLVDFDSFEPFWDMLNSVVGSSVERVLIDEGKNEFARVVDVDFDPVNELSFNDKLFIFDELMGPTRDLDRFRSRRKHDDDHAHVGEDVQHTPVVDSKPKRQRRRSKL